MTTLLVSTVVPLVGCSVYIHLMHSYFVLINIIQLFETLLPNYYIPTICTKVNVIVSGYQKNLEAYKHVI